MVTLVYTGVFLSVRVLSVVFPTALSVFVCMCLSVWWCGWGPVAMLVALAAATAHSAALVAFVGPILTYTHVFLPLSALHRAFSLPYLPIFMLRKTGPW